MGSVCVNITQQAPTANTVHRYTMTAPGRQPMAKQDLLKSAEVSTEPTRCKDFFVKETYLWTSCLWKHTSKVMGDRHCNLHKHCPYHCPLWPQPSEIITACKFASVIVLPRMCCPFAWPLYRTQAPFLRIWHHKNMARYKDNWRLWCTITLINEIMNYNHENSCLELISQNNPIKQVVLIPL